MTSVEPILSPIRERAKAYAEHGTPGLAAPRDRAALLAAVEAVLSMADGWEARGEHDMQFSKTVPDEYIAMDLLTNGAGMVENTRHIRNAVMAALREAYDPEPQPSDGPDYHAEHAAWTTRQRKGGL